MTKVIFKAKFYAVSEKSLNQMLMLKQAIDDVRRTKRSSVASNKDHQVKRAALE